MTVQELLELEEVKAFSHAGELNRDKLKLYDEVRDMCAQDRCQHYNKCWSCPPACGSIEDIREQIKDYHHGILVQSTGQMEDSFDVDTMMETEQEQKNHFFALMEKLREMHVDFYPMSAGTCTVCKQCAYPEPCRFPDKKVPSMEACGVFVSKVCSDSGIPYNYGKHTLTYTSCILIP